MSPALDVLVYFSNLAVIITLQLWGWFLFIIGLRIIRNLAILGSIISIIGWCVITYAVEHS